MQPQAVFLKRFGLGFFSLLWFGWAFDLKAFNRVGVATRFTHDIQFAQGQGVKVGFRDRLGLLDGDIKVGVPIDQAPPLYAFVGCRNRLRLEVSFNTGVNTLE